MSDNKMSDQAEPVAKNRQQICGGRRLIVLMADNTDGECECTEANFKLELAEK